MKSNGPTGLCPDCGSSLEKARFADVFHEENGKLVPNEDEIVEEWLCRKCGVRWGATILGNQTVVR